MTYLLRNSVLQKAFHLSRFAFASYCTNSTVIMPQFLRTKEDFAAALSGAGDKLVIVDYTASWCGPCQFIGPKFAEFSEQYKDCVFYKVDVDENNEVAEEQGISAMPTFIFYRSSKRVDSLTGADPAKLEAKIKTLK